MYFEFKRLSDFTKKDLEEIKFFTYKDGMARPIFINAAENKLKNAEDYILDPIDRGQLQNLVCRQTY